MTDVRSESSGVVDPPGDQRGVILNSCMQPYLTIDKRMGGTSRSGALDSLKKKKRMFRVEYFLKFCM